jgi:hypothetical protein
MYHYRCVENPEIPVETGLRVCSAGRGFSAQESSVVYHAVDASGVSPVPTAHIKFWRRRASALVRPPELRRQTIQSRSIQESMTARVFPVPRHISTTSSNRVGGEKFSGTTIEKNGLVSQESTLDAHSRIIEESIHATVLKRLQEEQQCREQAI